MRPSKNTDQLLIQAARELIFQKETLQIGLREVANHAQVNLGMFKYHFKNRDDFFEKVLQGNYEEFYAALKNAAENGEVEKTQDSAKNNAKDKKKKTKSLAKSDLKRLKDALCVISFFFVDNQEIIVAIIRGAINGDIAALNILRKNLHRHLGVIINLIDKCQRNGELKEMPLFTLFVMLMTSINGPTLMWRALTKNKMLKATIPILTKTKEKDVISKKAIETRIDYILNILQKQT